MHPEPRTDDDVDILNERLMSFAQSALTPEQEAVLRVNGFARARVTTALNQLELDPFALPRLRASLDAIGTAGPRGNFGEILSQFRAPPGERGVAPDGGKSAPVPAPVTTHSPTVFTDPFGRPVGVRSAGPKPINAGEDEVTMNSQHFRDQHVVYGRQHAVAFENCVARNKRHLTINLKAAEASDGADCKRGVAWDQAIIVSLEPHEIGLLLSALLGHLPRLRFAGHGSANDKWVAAEQTEGEFAGAVRVQVAQGNRRIGVNIGYRDIVETIGVCERAGTDGLRMRYIDTDLKIARQAALYGADLSRTRKDKSGGDSPGNRVSATAKRTTAPAPRGVRP